MENDNLWFMYKLDSKGYTEMGKREGKKQYFFMEGICAIMQFISLPGHSDAVLIEVTRQAACV